MSEALEPINFDLPTLPDPTLLRRTLRAAIDEAYAKAVADRPDTFLPEDTFALQRSLTAVAELFAAYQRAFGEMRRIVQTLQEEQLVDAVGEQAGVPMGGLTVPDPEGDIRIGLDTPNVHRFDLDQILTVLAQVSAERTGEYGTDPIRYALDMLLTLGKFEPQVSKIKAFAAVLSRKGSDDLASVITSAITTLHSYKGIKVERKESKP